MTIGQLVEAGKAAAAEAQVEVRTDRGERRAIVAAVRELVTRGIVEETDGQLESYLDSDDAPVLLTIFHTRLLHLITNFDATTDPGEDPKRWLHNVAREPDASRRMRRRLIDDTCVHSVDLDEAEQDWLSRRLRGDDGGPLAAAFGLVIERRTEGAAFVVPDDAFRWPRELGDVPFPGAGIVPTLPSCWPTSSRPREHRVAPAAGWRGLPRERVLPNSPTSPPGRPPDEAAGQPSAPADPAGLLKDAEGLLISTGLLRMDIGWWWLSPAMGRWEAPPNSAFSGGLPPTPRAEAEPSTLNPELF